MQTTHLYSFINLQKLQDCLSFLLKIRSKAASNNSFILISVIMKISRRYLKFLLIYQIFFLLFCERQYRYLHFANICCYLLNNFMDIVVCLFFISCFIICICHLFSCLPGGFYALALLFIDACVWFCHPFIKFFPSFLFLNGLNKNFVTFPFFWDIFRLCLICNICILLRLTCCLNHFFMCIDSS